MNWFGPIPTAASRYNINQRVDHRFSDKDSFYVRTTVADSYGKNLFTAGQLMLNDMYGREINTEGRMSIGSDVDPYVLAHALQRGDPQRRAASTGGRQLQSGPHQLHGRCSGTPNPFGVGTEAAPQFTGTGLDGYDFRENQYKRHRTNNLDARQQRHKDLGQARITVRWRTSGRTS